MPVRLLLTLSLVAALAAPAVAQSPTDVDPAPRLAPVVYAPAAVGPSDVAIGYDARYQDAEERTLLEFRIDSGAFPTDGANLAAPDGELVNGCDFDDTDLDRMVCVSRAGQLFSVALATGETSVIGLGAYPGNVSDLTYSAADDAWYALAAQCAAAPGDDPADDRSTLVRVDAVTGAATAIGTGTATSFCGLGLAAAPDGVVYAYSAATDGAVSRAAGVDPETGDFSILGPTGLDAFYAQSMDCDASDGACYAFGYLGSGSNGLFRLSPTSGFLTSFGELPEGSELTAAAIATTTAMTVSSEEAPSADTALRVVSATPARGTLRLAVAAPGQLDVHDALGRRVAQRDVTGGTVSLDVSGWAPGVYVVRLRGGGAAARRRVTVVR